MKNLVFHRGNPLTEPQRVTIVARVEKIHPAEADVFGRRRIVDFEHG